MRKKRNEPHSRAFLGEGSSTATRVVMFVIYVPGSIRSVILRASDFVSKTWPRIHSVVGGMRNCGVFAQFTSLYFRLVSCVHAWVFPRLIFATTFSKHWEQCALFPSEPEFRMRESVCSISIPCAVVRWLTPVASGGIPLGFGGVERLSVANSVEIAYWICASVDGIALSLANSVMMGPMEVTVSFWGWQSAVVRSKLVCLCLWYPETLNFGTSN